MTIFIINIYLTGKQGKVNPNVTHFNTVFLIWSTNTHMKYLQQSTTNTLKASGYLGRFSSALFICDAPMGGNPTLNGFLVPSGNQK